VYLLASGISTNMKALAEQIAACVPNAKACQMGEHDAEDGRVWAFDISRTREAFRLPPARSLADGLVDLIKGWQAGAEANAWWRPC
jgi:hypothetical protein